MDNPLIIVAIFCAGIGIGAGVCFAIMRTSAQSFAIRAHAEVKHREAVRREAMEELKTVRQQLKQKSDAYNSLRIQAEKINTTLVNERSASQEKIATIESAEKRMTHTFQALASQSLRNNNDSFMQVAQEILKQHTQSASGDLDKRKHEITRIMQPIEQSLKQVQLHVTDLEKQRVSAYSGLQEQVRGLLESQKGLKDETSKLTHALRSPGFAGSWGQIQLRRVVELSGMVAHCDFTEQQTVGHGSNQQRPDMVIHLPGDTDIVVDAKASMTAYSEAVNSQDLAVQNDAMKEHARHVRNHFQQLSKKAYTEQFKRTPEFVAMFLPGDGFLSAALQHDEKLFDDAVNRKVLLASPTTLIALLKAVAYGWQHEQLTRNAQEICEVGRELYDSMATPGEQLAKVGKGLQTATEAYNGAIGNIEQRVLVSARRFKDLHVRTGGRDIPILTPLEHSFRQSQSPELVASDAALISKRTLFPVDDDGPTT